MVDFPFFENRNRLASVASALHVQGPPDNRPFWLVGIEDAAQTPLDITANVVSIDVTSDPQGGLSCSMVLNQRVAGFDGKNMVVRAGYGQNYDRVFFGRIRGYTEPAYTDLCTVRAYGVAVIRGKQRINMGLDFSNMTLRDAMEYINAESPTFGEFGMIGGEEYTIHDPEADRGTEAETNQPGYGVFGSETTWTEVERSLLEPTGYVAYDNPLGHVIHRTPELRYGGDPVNYTWWWPGNIAMGQYDSFTFDVGERDVYNRVVAFRRTQDYGEFVTEDQGVGKPKRVREFYSVYAEMEVNRTGRYQMPIGTDDVIPDFNGTQAEAEAEVARRAQAYETVRGTFEAEGPLKHYWQNDVAYYERVEHRPGVRLSQVTGVPVPSGDSTYVKSVYTCLLNGTLNHRMAKTLFKTTVRGDGALHSMSAIPDPGDASYRSTGLVPVGVA